MLKNWLKEMLKGGLKLKISSGKMFDPHETKRTTWREDIEKKKGKHNEDISDTV